jgi:hypothetical protein
MDLTHYMAGPQPQKSLFDRRDLHVVERLFCMAVGLLVFVDHQLAADCIPILLHVLENDMHTILRDACDFCHGVCDAFGQFALLVERATFHPFDMYERQFVRLLGV